MAARKTCRMNCLVSFLAFCAGLAFSQQGLGFHEEKSWPGGELFTNGAVHRLSIEINPKDAESLRHQVREFVRATVTERGAVFRDVAVRLKGSVGSFRPLDEKPSFTLDFDRFKAGQKFHDLRRIHLNNSVEDPSYCNELLGSELFRQA